MTSGYLNTSTDDYGNVTDSSLSPLGESRSSARTSALSNKITSVLSSSYADSDIRDALSILDLRGVKNNPETRRKLRLDAQREVIECNGQIVQDFGKVAEQVKRIGTMIETLNNTCAEIRRHISLAQQETAPMLDEASTLLAAKEEGEIKQQLLDAFNQHFIISDDDLMTLTSSANPVDDHFFSILRRVKQIHKDCEVLLGNENQRLGLDLMEQTSRNLDAAFKKLYKWVQREFKNLDLEDPHISASIRTALRVLSERPTLFQNCLGFFAEVREHVLAEAFRAALTDGVGRLDKSGPANPIEFSTHDPLRYIGDMLAWVHSATVSEKQALEGLFISDGYETARGIKEGRDKHPWSRSNDANVGAEEAEEQVFNGREALDDLIDRNLAGVTRALRQRIEVAVRGADDPVLIYKVHSLLKFYHDIFAKLVGMDATLTTTVTDLQSSTFSHVEQLLQDEVATMPHDIVDTTDLCAPDFFIEALDRLSMLAKANADATSEDYEQLLSVALVPYMNQCAVQAQHINNSIYKTVFTLNYILAAHSTLSSLPATSAGLLNKMEQKMEDLMNELVAEQHDIFLRDSGLDELIGSLADKGAKDQVFSEGRLSAVSAQLDRFLTSALMNAQDNLKQLSDRSLAENVVAEASQRFCADFDKVEEVVESLDVEGSDGGIEDDEAEVRKLRGVFPRTSAEIRVLLS